MMSQSIVSNEFNSLVELLNVRAQLQPNKIAYTFLLDGEQQTESLTYRELDTKARSIAAFLQAKSLQGERAVLLYPQGLDYITAFFGCLYAGVIAVPAYPPKNQRHLPRLQAIIDDSSAAIILSHQTVAHSARTLHINTERWVLTDQELLADASCWQMPDLTLDSLAFLQYTSGSTGAAKGVMVSHGNLLANQQLIKDSFEHNHDSTVVGWLPLYHDMGLIGNVMQPLYSGANVVLMSPMAFLEKPIRWLQAISDHRANTSGAPNFAFELCVQKISEQEKAKLDLSSWTLAFNGAEPIHPNTLDKFARAFADCGFKAEAFYPCYGLAEATLFVTGGKKSLAPTIKAFNKQKLAEHLACTDFVQVNDYRRLVACGTTGNGHHIRIVNPDTQTRCEQGHIGEIQVSGASVAQGYWQNPKATSATFIEDAEGTRWLRTGDLGFIEQDELFVSGRLKDLIIVRGRNYYPHDLEKAAESAVDCLNADSLAAFAVSTEATETLVLLAELKRSHSRLKDFRTEFAAIRRRLVEECDIQVDTIVFLKPNAILKTTSGKIRRSACKALYEQQQLDIIAIDELYADTSAMQASVQPKDESQTFALSLLMMDSAEAIPKLAQHLAKRIALLSGLNAAQIEISASVLSLGLDSLKAIDLKYSIDELLHIDLPLSLLLNDSSLLAIAELALTLAQQDSIPAIKPCVLTDEISLSLGQQALWTLCQVTSEPTIYNMSIALQISSVLNHQALQLALQTLVQRHSQLRANFSLNEKNQLRQTIAQQVSLSLLGQHCTTEADRQEKISAFLKQPFALERELLFRAALFSRQPDNHVLVFCAHHLLIDLRSMTILLAELKQLYHAQQAQQTLMLPVLNSSYQDYLHWQTHYLQSSAAEQAWQYWQQQLSGELPKLQLVQQHFSSTPSYHGAVENLLIDVETLKQLRAFADKQQVTLYVLLLTVFKTLLYRYSGQKDVIVGSPLLGRPKQVFAELVGYFVNPVALRSKPLANKTFIEYLAEVKQTVLNALQHQDYPFSLLVEKLQPERSAGLSPFYQTWFVLQGHDEAAALALGVDNVSVDWADLQVKSYALPDTIAQFDLTLMMAETEHGLLASFQYRRDLFEPTTIKQLTEHFQTLLHSVLTQATQRLSALPLLTEAQQRQLLAWNATETVYGQKATGIHELIERQAEKTPNAIAVSFQEQQLTYAELNHQANQLAHYLIAQGVRLETRVAVCMERSLNLIVSLLAVLKAGGAYLPIDPHYPTERQRYILHNADVSLLLTDSQTQLSEFQKVTRILVDDEHLYCHQSTQNPRLKLFADNTAYIIYTSGSTGQPKGVLVSHANVLHSTLARHDYYAQPMSCYLLLSSFAFDSSVAGIFWTLSLGACLCLPTEQQPKDPMSLGKLIAERQVSHLLALPSLYAAMLATVSPATLSSLRTVIVAGEACGSQVVEQHYQQLPQVELHNEYGPTEATVWSSVHALANHQPISIGKPISNTQCYLLNNDLSPIPVGAIGEIYIGGLGITRGYLYQEALTAERFVPNPFGTGDRLYKTGDLAYYHTDGSLMFCGRADQQVKLRGYRIECGEIESRLLAHSAIQEAVVMIRQEQLVAYLVGNSELDLSDLKTQLQTVLPDYMVPSAFVSLSALPLNANGKIDRRALLDIEANLITASTFVAPRDEVESAIAQIWQEVLGVEKLSIHDDFFDLGGHSLSSVQVVARVQAIFDLDVPVNLLFEAPTIAEFVDKLTEYQN